jgi:hypothetical protein
VGSGLRLDQRKQVNTVQRTPTRSPVNTRKLTWTLTPLIVLATLTALAAPAGAYSYNSDYTYLGRYTHTPSKIVLPIKWNPNQTNKTITYAISAAACGKANTASWRSCVHDIQTALGRTAARTGFTYKYMGVSAFLPQNTSFFKTSQYKTTKGQAVELLIAIGNETPGASNYSNLLKGTRYTPWGVGGPTKWDNTCSKNPTSSVDKALITGSCSKAMIVRGLLIVRKDLTPGFKTTSSRGVILQHEIGHAMGLGHAGNPQDLMYPKRGTSRALDWNKGDIYALTQLGTRTGVNYPNSTQDLH